MYYQQKNNFNMKMMGTDVEGQNPKKEQVLLRNI